MSVVNVHLNQKTSNVFLETIVFLKVESLSFLTNHAKVLLRIARDPGARLRDITAGYVTNRLPPDQWNGSAGRPAQRAGK